MVSESAAGRFMRSLGPAFITASVVLGPGSIVTSTQVGSDFGFRFVWLVAAAAALMIGMTAIGARLGVGLAGTPCEEIAQRFGRGAAVVVGLLVFVVVACFQFGNNVGIYAALEPFLGSEAWLAGMSGPAVVVVALNVMVAVFLFGLKDVYRWVERAMMAVVAVMLLAFAANFALVLAMGAGSDSAGSGESVSIGANLVPQIVGVGAERGVVDPLRPLVGLVATTFSVAGAFFQAYLVRQKGGTVADVRAGLVDSVAGISVLAVITLVIMCTSASVLRGATITSAGDIAMQLEPLFGSGATVLFCVGLFAAATSSLLVNAVIGGSLLADGLGLGGYLDRMWPKVFTLLALCVGLIVALLLQTVEEFNPVGLILVAQAVTVIAWPLLAAAMLWLAAKAVSAGKVNVPRWMWVVGGVGVAVALVLAPRTAYLVWLRLSIL